jgi:hypothetical protein
VLVGQYERVGCFSDIERLYYDGAHRDLNRRESMITGPGDDAEKALMTENVYEEYGEAHNHHHITKFTKIAEIHELEFDFVFLSLILSGKGLALYQSLVLQAAINLLSAEPKHPPK